MTTAEERRARRDARELATTPPADPYRGALTDPYARTAGPVRPSAAGPVPAGRLPAREPVSNTTSATADHRPPPGGTRTPGQAVLAGILAISTGAVVGLFGLLLLAIISLQKEYGAPDRSFYRGSDSSYLLLALLDFALGACLVVGGISFLTGRLVGRVTITAAGGTVLVLCGFWWLQASVEAVVPLIVALLSLGMLVLSYQASVTRWLGVLPAAQPE
jgi:hypothetical protein